MQTTNDYGQILRQNKDLIIKTFRQTMRMRLESSAGFLHLRDVTRSSMPFAVKDALDGILDALRVHIGPLTGEGLGQIFVTFKRSKLNLLSNDLPQRVWALTQKRSPSNEPTLAFLGEIIRLGSDLDCVANINWRIGTVNKTNFRSSGYRFPESEFLQEITLDTLAICSDSWSIEKGDFK